MHCENPDQIGLLRETVNKRVFYVRDLEVDVLNVSW